MIWASPEIERGTCTTSLNNVSKGKLQSVEMHLFEVKHFFIIADTLMGI